MAVIVALEAIKKFGMPITVFSDSKYVIDAIVKGWLWGWQKKNFAKKANADLWQRYIPLHHRFQPKFSWVKGHAGHPENERCDQLAVSAALSDDLLIDSWYEENRTKNRIDFDQSSIFKNKTYPTCPKPPSNFQKAA